MILAFLAAIMIGAACATVALWFGGFATATSAAAATTSGRLARLRPGGEGTIEGAAQIELSSGPALRARTTSVGFGGLSFLRGDFIQAWEYDLERAGLTLNVREYFVLRVAVGFGVGALFALLVPQFALPLLLVGGIVGFLLPKFWIAFRKRQRKQKFESQIAELLTMMASALRAGFGLSQAFEAAAKQLSDPIGAELRHMLQDTSVGSSVEQALQAMNERLDSADFDIVVSAIMIQRSVGGNLAEILDTVAHTMRERDRIRGEIRTLTAQQRLSGYVLGALPIAQFIFFYLINPDYTGLLLTDPVGRLMLAVGVVLWVIGFIVIQKIVNIDI